MSVETVPSSSKTSALDPPPARWGQTEQETYFGALDRALVNGEDRAFLDFDEGTVTYGDIDRQSTRLANALSDLGVGQGHTVVTVLDSSADAVVIWFAVNRLGAIWVPINTAYRGEFLRHQIADSSARLLICEDIYLEQVVSLADQFPDLERILCRGMLDEGLQCPIPVASLDAHRGANDMPISFRPAPDDVACLIYTSGTTGRSKGCMISHNYLCNGARQQNIGIPPLPGETTWTCLPLFHVGATSYVVIATLIAEARARIAKRFSVTAFWEDIERSGATTAMLMASMLPLLAQAPDSDAMHRCRGRLRAVTGVPLTEKIRKIWHERFGVSHMNSFGYGQTEASKICNLPWGEALPPLTSAGPPSEDFEVMVAGPNGLSLPAGACGEILVRPRQPNIMFSGYWRRPEDTVTVWRDLWMHTGDIGKFDDEGYLYFVDRQKDYVRSRGENISSLEVEAALMMHPAISEVAFHAVPAPSDGEDALKITVVLREGVVVTEEQLCRWSIDSLPYFAVPRFVEFRTELPKTPTGRVQKHRLRDEGCTPRTWDAHAAGIVVRRNSAGRG